jgi:hypothetical protein
VAIQESKLSLLQRIAKKIAAWKTTYWGMLKDSSNLLTFDPRVFS